MDVSSEPAPAPVPAEAQPLALDNWKELTNATILSQGAEAVRQLRLEMEETILPALAAQCTTRVTYAL